MESSFLKYLDFEEEVFELLQSQLSKNEPIERDKRFGQIMADALLSKGCARLKFPPNTLIEIKYRIGYDIANRVLGKYKNLITSNDFYLVIICKENLAKGYHNYAEVSDRYTIKTFDELHDKLKKSDNSTPNIENIAPIDFETESKEQYDKAKDAFAINKVSLFLGAGVSMDAKMPGWNSLLKGLLKQTDSIPFEHINEMNSEAISEALANSSIIEGRYIFEGYLEGMQRAHPELSRGELRDLSENEIKKRIRDLLYNSIGKQTSSNLVKAVAKIAREKNIQQIITYNYDDLIETQIDNGNAYVSVYNESISLINGKKAIYHVHGYIPRNENCPGVPILSEKDYHTLYNKINCWANIVQLHALYTTTCFFIGFSMTDPNQRRLLDLARNANVKSIDPDKAPHYVFLQRKGLKGEAEEKVNKEHMHRIERMMYELGLNVIWFDDFAKLPDLLLYIAGKRKDCPI